MGVAFGAMPALMLRVIKKKKMSAPIISNMILQRLFLISFCSLEMQIAVLVLT